MDLEDRAREHIAARDAKAANEAQFEQIIARWQERQRVRVREILSEFIRLARNHRVAQVWLFYVAKLERKPLFGKERLESNFERVAQVWELGNKPLNCHLSIAGDILTVTEDLRVIPATRVQNRSGEYVLAIDDRWATKDFRRNG